MDLRQTCPIDVKAQARVDSELVLWREWADNDERTELLPCPLLEPVVLANKRADRRPQKAPAIKAAFGVIQAEWWTQEVANSCVWALRSSDCGLVQPIVKPALTFLRLISTRERLRLATNTNGREALDARPC